MLFARYALPQMVQRGLNTVLTLDVFNDAGDRQAAAAGTVTVHAGSRVVVDAQAVTTGGSVTASFTLTGATTTDQALSDDWIGVWTLTIGGAVVEDLHRPIMLVRRLFAPVITDTDLDELHSDLAELQPSGRSDWSIERVAAFEMIERGLIRRARRPHLILDSWALLDLHRYTTLQIIFRDADSSVGDGRYKELAAQYAELVAGEWDALQFRYDVDEDGRIDDGPQIGSTPILYLSSSPAWRGG